MKDLLFGIFRQDVDGYDFFKVFSEEFICSMTIEELKTQPYPKANYRPYKIIEGKKVYVDKEKEDKFISLKEIIRDVLEEHALALDIDEIYNKVKSDDLMTDVISYTIYKTLSNKLNEDKKLNDTIHYMLGETKYNLLTSLKYEGLI